MTARRLARGSTPVAPRPCRPAHQLQVPWQADGAAVRVHGTFRCRALGRQRRLGPASRSRGHLPPGGGPTDHASAIGKNEVMSPLPDCRLRRPDQADPGVAAPAGPGARKRDGARPPPPRAVGERQASPIVLADGPAVASRLLQTPEDARAERRRVLPQARPCLRVVLRRRAGPWFRAEPLPRGLRACDLQAPHPQGRQAG